MQYRSPKKWFAKKTPLRAGFDAGFGAHLGFDQMQPRRRKRIFDNYAADEAVMGDLRAVWGDFARAISRQANEYFHGNYDVTIVAGDDGKPELQYRQKPRNKKMEDAGGWGK